MLIVNRRKYRKQYVVGGSGIFDTISGFVKRLVSSNAAKQLASRSLSASKDVAKEIGKKAIDVGKSAATDAGKRLVDKVATKLFTPPKKPEITPETWAIIDRLSSVGVEPNINNLMMGNGLKNAVSIQDLVRSQNGAGMKVA
jgi:hypothetical protein